MNARKGNTQNRNRISKPNKGYLNTEQKPQKRSKKMTGNRKTENPNAFLLTSWLIYPEAFFLLVLTLLAGGELGDLCHPGYLSANSDYSSNKLRILGSCSHPPRCCLSK